MANSVANHRVGQPTKWFRQFINQTTGTTGTGIQNRNTDCYFSYGASSSQSAMERMVIVVSVVVATTNKQKIITNLYQMLSRQHSLYHPLTQGKSRAAIDFFWQGTRQQCCTIRVYRRPTTLPSLPSLFAILKEEEIEEIVRSGSNRVMACPTWDPYYFSLSFSVLVCFFLGLFLSNVCISFSFVSLLAALAFVA